MNIAGKYYDICQSCSMPLKSLRDYGTNKDGSENYEYCFKCFNGGKFLAPEITLSEMISGCTNILIQFGMPPAEAKEKMEHIIPTLKRWKNI
jgi:hypothetical protein